MATYPAKGGKEFAKVSAGTHMAVCTLVADVGLQPGSGKFPDPKIKIYLRFEIPSERIAYEKDGQQVEGPAVIYHNWNASMNAKATMRKHIESWRGAKFSDAEAEQFDVRKLLGQSCMLQVIHTEDGQYANVANIMAPPKGMPKLKPEGTPVYYGPDDDVQYDFLPKFLKEKVDHQLSAGAPSQAAASSRAATSGMSPAEVSAAEQEASRQAANAKPSGEFVDDNLDEINY
jgi:hypothetical protein